MLNRKIGNYFKEIIGILESTDADQISKSLSLLKSVRAASRNVYIIGNGGSNAISSHVSVDLLKNCGLKSLTFNDTGLITCFANDYTWENYLSRCVETHLEEGDLLIAISSRGESKNIINAILSAKEKKCPIITLTGFDSANAVLRLGSDINIYIPSQSYNVVEIAHLAILLGLVEELRL